MRRAGVRRLAHRGAAHAALALIVLLAVTAGHLLSPQRATAREMTAPVQVGVSFSQRRAAALGLDYQDAFRQVLAMHFKVIRLAAYWDDVNATGGYDQLDWLMETAAAAHQPVVLTVGMKSLGWPEFYIPPIYKPHVSDGEEVGKDAQLRAAALEFVSRTAERYQAYPNLVAWQVENEPYNRAGPNRWWIGPDLLQQEVAAVRAAGQHPVIVNVFSHFNMQFDQAASRNGVTLGSLLGFDTDSAERDTLAALQPGDVLGFDVYTRIGYRFLGQDGVATADGNWDDHVARWRSVAAAEGKHTWITEAQAEPWEADWSTYATPKSFAPSDLEQTFHDLKDSGQTTVLLWGAEYWLWRLQNGDPTWIEAVRQILRDEARSAPLS
jgi:hypothetical protein